MAILPGLMEKKSQFIAVGALHLAVPKGILHHLQQWAKNYARKIITLSEVQFLEQVKQPRASSSNW